jgi:predicted nucleic acid-binding protein
VTVYLDTSALLRKLLNRPDAYPHWGRWDAAYTSALTRVEASRTLDRLRLQNLLSDTEIAEVFESLAGYLERIGDVPVSKAVLRRASQPFPTVIKTLDAIHLATAILWQDQHLKPLAFLTHDAGLGTAARALGFKLTL